MTKTYEHKYKLGERVAVKQPGKYKETYTIMSVHLGGYYGPEEKFICYESIGGIQFGEDEVLGREES